MAYNLSRLRMGDLRVIYFECPLRAGGIRIPPTWSKKGTLREVEARGLIYNNS